MKKIMMLLAAAMLLLGLNGQAMASFQNGDLIRVVYSATGGMETATDLGAITSSLITSNITFSSPVFNIASLGSGATAANSYVAYYAYSLDSSFNDNVWTSGKSGGQVIANSLAGSSFANAAAAMAGTYSTATGASSGQVTIATSNAGSYYANMNFSGLGNGQMAGYTPNADAQKNLAALATTGYVDQTLYFYNDNGNMDNSSGQGIPSVVAADIRTLANGTTEIVQTATPVPPSILLMGSGLLGLAGIGRKRTV